jgi:hypothetical protein
MSKGKIAFANGTAVQLTGAVKEVSGKRYWVGVALVGHFKGREYIVSQHESVFDYSEVKSMLEEEQENYDRLMAVIDQE